MGLLGGAVAAVLLAAAGLGVAQDAPVNAVQAPDTPPPPSLVTPPPAPVLATPEAPPVDAAPPPEPAPPETPPPALAPSANAIASAAENAVADAAPPEPPKRPRLTTAVLQALDKVTAETLRFEAKVNEPVRYKDLVITVHACETEAPDETFRESAAHLEVQYQPDVLPGRAPQVARQVFRGWMFGNSPGLHPFEHPIYDLWVIACKTPSPPPPAAPAPAAPGAKL